MAYKNDSAEQEFQERVVTINRVSKTVKGVQTLSPHPPAGF